MQYRERINGNDTNEIFTIGDLNEPTCRSANIIIKNIDDLLKDVPLRKVQQSSVTKLNNAVFQTFEPSEEHAFEIFTLAVKVSKSQYIICVSLII